MQSTRAWRCKSFVTLLCLAVFQSQPTGNAQSGIGSISVKTVDYDALGQLIREHTGKVVVVDLWSTT
jgi:hypothetical protein